MLIKLYRADGALGLTPAPPYLLKYLKYYHRGFKTVKYRRENDFKEVLLYSIDEAGMLYTMHGFFPKVCELIEANGDTYEVTDSRTPMPAIDWPAIQNIDWSAIDSKGLRDYQVQPIAEFLVQSQQTSGIINATGGFGKTIVQAVTYAAYNSLNTILAIPLKQVFLQTYEKFRLLFPDRHIGRVGGGYHDLSSDITITTLKSLEGCAIEKCQLLLIDELQSTTGPVISKVFSKATPIRVFGYTATDKGLFNQAEKLIEGLFGRRLIYIPYQEAQGNNAVVPVTVWAVRTSTDIIVDAANMEGKIKQGIMRATLRNELIAQACRSVPNGWQTLVFVDLIKEHLIPLYKLMPEGTRYIHRSTSKKEIGEFALSSKQQAQALAEYQNNEYQYLIATDAFRAGVDIPNCRVVVQASGGSSEVELLQEAYRGSRILPKGRQEELQVDEKTHLVLIDFVDQHDPALLSMSEKRLGIYRGQGWEVRVVDHVDDINWHYYKESEG